MRNIFPLISKMLKDEVLEVRQSTLENLNDLNKFFNNSNLLINHIIPLFNEISKETKWRLRLALAEKIKNFYDILGNIYVI
ncbi:MAG: HEAT repeat domain-containing protein [Flammeovirgaceae bacterium]